MKSVLIAAFLVAATPAFAEQFVPFQIDQATYKDLMTYLGDVPAKYAIPLIGALERKEQDAIAKAKADAESKPKEKD